MAHASTTPSSSRPSVLVLTLFSGEAEFGKCRASLQGQTYLRWDHRVFEGLPNAEAHRRLYATIMAESDRHEIFFKLDADMVLADSEVLSDLVQVFEERPDVDHLLVAVTDWMTDSLIIGAHLFSRRVRWKEHGETLYVDPDPEFPGRKVVVERPPRDLVFHAGNPSPLQAFHFGAHRALQASQVYRRLRDVRAHNARVQWQYLERVWGHYLRSGDRRLGLAILAADAVFRKELPETVNQYTDPSLLRAFENASSLENDEIRRRLSGRWNSPAVRRRMWLQTLGPAKTTIVAARALRDAAARSVKRISGSARPDVEIGTRS